LEGAFQFCAQILLFKIILEYVYRVASSLDSIIILHIGKIEITTNQFIKIEINQSINPSIMASKVIESWKLVRVIATVLITNEEVAGKIDPN
jgi:hypothetical protein